jgi:hypothetical protein
MSDDERRAKFQLIRKPRKVMPCEDQFAVPAIQSLLFPIPKPDLLIFLVFPLVTEDEFTRILELTRPVCILELRRSPRFDVGHFNRREAFRWFEAMHSKYYDLSSRAYSDDRYADDPVHLVEAFLNRSGQKIAGPVMILISQGDPEPDDQESSVSTQIAKLFAAASKHSWKTVEVPQYA